jgi:uncharacterized protein DUF6529
MLTPEEQPPVRSASWLLVPLLVFAWVTLVFATAANVNRLVEGDAAPKYFDLFFSDTLHMKAWLALIVALLALFQVFSAAWIFRKLPWSRPRWINAGHRWSGRAAFLLSLPVAYHCIFLLGFQDTSTRALAHSFLGCFFYGAFAAKVTIVRLHNYPRWVLPAAGGLVFAILIALWYTSSLWFFESVGVDL